MIVQILAHVGDQVLFQCAYGRGLAWIATTPPALGTELDRHIFLPDVLVWGEDIWASDLKVPGLRCEDDRTYIHARIGRRMYSRDWDPMLELQLGTEEFSVYVDFLRIEDSVRHDAAEWVVVKTRTLSLSTERW